MTVLRAVIIDGVLVKGEITDDFHVDIAEIYAFEHKLDLEALAADDKLQFGFIYDDGEFENVDREYFRKT